MTHGNNLIDIQCSIRHISNKLVKVQCNKTYNVLSLGKVQRSIRHTAISWFMFNLTHIFDNLVKVRFSNLDCLSHNVLQIMQSNALLEVCWLLFNK